MPSLHVSLPEGADATHELTDDVITVGRVSDNTLQIEDASVSSHHAELLLREGEYILKDIGSTNGSQVNGRAVAADEETRLRHGDTIIFGHIAARYLTEAGGENTPLPPESEPDSAPATTAVAPVDFSNASPFQKRSKEKDGATTAAMVVGAVALLAAFGALALIFQMKSPL